MNSSSLNSPEPVSSGIGSVLEDSGELSHRVTFNAQNNEPKPPLQFLLLDNPNDLCWLNTDLNILYQEKNIRNTYYMSPGDKPIWDHIARIFQGVDKSAEQLRSMLSETKLHTGPQNAAEVLQSLLEDLGITFTKDEATYCNCCNTILINPETMSCPKCNIEELPQGYLLTLKGRSCFLISWNRIPVLRPNDQFNIHSAKYRLTAFAQYIEETGKDQDGKKYVVKHYVSWIRKPETNEEEKNIEKEKTTNKNDIIEEECGYDIPVIQEDTNEEQNKINNASTTTENNQEVNENNQMLPEIPTEVNHTIDNNQNTHSEYSICEDFVCIDDHQISNEYHLLFEEMHINLMLLEPC